MLDSSKPVRVVTRSIKTEPSEATANTSSIDYCADIVK